MDSQAQNQQAGDAENVELNDFGRFAVKFLQFGENASNNISSTFQDMTPTAWLRLVIVAGGYLLLRPYVLKWLGKKHVENMQEKDDQEKKAKITANQLRGMNGPVDIDELSDEEGESSSANWGAKARIRQRHMIKTMLEAEERRVKADDDDKDIEDLLED